MGMDKGGLADKIEGAVKGKDTPDGAGADIGKAIFDYIKANAEIKYQWSGVNPSGASDPSTSFECKLTSAVGPWKWPSGAKEDSADAAMAAFGNAVNTHLNMSLLDMGAWVIAPPLMLLSTCSLKPSGKDDGRAAIEDMADGILKGLKVTPGGAGTHGAFTGAAAGGSIK